MDINELKKIAADCLDRLVAAGADEAKCLVCSGYSHELNAENNEWSLMRTCFREAVTLTAHIGKKRGTASLNSFDPEAIEEGVRECIEAAGNADGDEGNVLAEKTENRDFSGGAKEPDMDRFFDRLREYIDDVRKGREQLNIESLTAEYSFSRGVLANTKGVCQSEENGEYSFGIMYSAHDGDRTTSFNSVGARTDTLDRPFIEYADQKRMLDACIEELDARPVEEKFVGTAVFMPSCAEEFIDTAAGLFASTGCLVDKTSVWLEKLGEKVASDALTVAFDPFDSRVVCGERFTDDGYLSEPFSFIENGVLKQFLVGLYGAEKTGFGRAPNSSGSMIITPGEKSLDEIVAGIDKGILVGRFSGGAPAQNGDFSGVAKNSFLISGGRLAGAVTETMISGNIAEMLMNITDISRETVCDGGSVIPYVAVSGITVS
ncbi:MAG: TldD/PmbA family protein [Clostridia bacterium]|nr:TldD/PmbA family protein [Clostridia bacterium]